MSKRVTRVLSLVMILCMFLSVGTPAFALGGSGELDEGWDQELSVLGEDPSFAEEDDPEDNWDEEIDEGYIRPFDEDIVEEDPDPALELFAENEEFGYSVTVEAPYGALPTLAELRVEPVEIEDIREAVEKMLGDEPNILIALDISFWLNGVEIEPQDPVQVIIAAPELEGRDDLALIHLPEEDEPEAIELIDEDDLAFELGTNEIVFQSDSFSAFAVVGTNRTATVNYGFMENNRFVPFESRNISSTSSSYPSQRLDASNYTSRPAYLVYDFPGYTYKETRLGNARTGTQIWPALTTRDAGGWFSTEYRFRYSNYSSATFSANDLDPNANIYVIYEPIEVTTGAGAQPDNPDNPVVDTPDLPAAKSVEPNGDGTYNITLSVTGVQAQQETVTKASVIVIFDVSDSMRWDMASNTNPSNSSQSRLNIAKGAVKALASELLSKEDSQHNKLVQMALVSFATTASVHSFGGETYTSSADLFNAEVDSLEMDGITNWEQALLFANSLEVSSEAPTYVIFVSDGDPTLHVSRRDLTDRQVYDLQRLEYYYDVYGDSNGLSSQYGSSIRMGMFGYMGGRFDPEYWPLTQEHYDAAIPAGQAILNAGKEFYTIGLSSSVTRMETFTSDVGAASDHYFPATSQSALTDAFDEIADAVTENLGFTDVSIDDGVTEMTSIESDALTGTPTNFVYRKGTNQQDPTQNDEWTGEGVPEAEITNDNHVIWNIASIGALENGVTYSVTFTVWPSQESYDIIADINNGIIRDENGNIIRTGTPAEAYAAQPDSVKRQIVIVDGVYTLLTNTGANVSYKFNGAEGTGGVEVKKEGSMELGTTYFGVHKDWHNGMDTRTANVLTKEVDGKKYLIDSNGDFILDDDNNPIEYDRNNLDPRAVFYIDLIVTEFVGDQEEDYTEITLTSEDLTAEDGNGAWDWNKMFIAPGVLTYTEGATSGELDIREPGRDYSVREKPNESYYWNLTAEVYHPMIINGEACVLQKVTDDDTSVPADVKNNNDTFSGDYFNIGGKVYKKLGSADDALITAVNNRRSMLWVTKEVEGTGAPEDATFAIKVTMDNADGLYRGDEGYNYWYDAFWFAVQTDPKDRDTVVKEGVTVEGATAETDDNGPTGFYWFDNGGSATIYIKAGQYLCFTNLPYGTTYTIEELSGDKMPDGFLYDDVDSDAQANYTGFTPTKAELDKDNRKATGTIDASNSDYSVTYTNQYCGYFYVYHSSDNTVQRFLAAQNDVAVKNFNISALTRENTLYGGYYSSYAGTGASFDAAGLTYTNNSSKDEGEGAKKYDGGNVAWNLNDVFTDEDGMHLTPVGGTVYYLKEVPANNYLIPYLHFTYYAETNKIGSAWLISDTDDYYYLETGFVVTHADDGSQEFLPAEYLPAKLATQLTVTASSSGEKQILKPTEVFTSEQHIGYDSPTKGYLTYRKVINVKTSVAEIADGDLIQQYWITPDGVLVVGRWGRTYSGLTGVVDSISKVDSSDNYGVMLPPERP